MVARILILAALLLPMAVKAAPSYPLCYSHGCTEVTELQLDEAQWREVAAHFSPEPADAAEERRRIARAIAALERLSGELSGITAQDRGGNAAGSGRPGQMDCIDESTNTTTYLRLLQRHGLLHHHVVTDKRKRLLFGMFAAHWSAVIAERADGTRFAVDSWFLDNGEEPVILPLEAWLAHEETVEPPPLEFDDW